MSTLLTVSQAILAVPRICIEGGFRDETAATSKQGSPGKRPGLTKRFIVLVVTERRDNRRARRPKSLLNLRARQPRHNVQRDGPGDRRNQPSSSFGGYRRAVAGFVSAVGAEKSVLHPNP
ncbi:hypothetical protein [Bradyrhizobium ottawaense]|uniref:hypothetical protein n=1 Tax=Bradyrhizobium ottawaense TaxID=931866 RepID=UPI003F9F9F6D